jgi:hypothetical protein
MSTARRNLSVAFALILAAAPTVAAPSRPYGAESPQALVARARAAAEREDFAELMACLAPDARREMAMVMAAGAGMMIAFAGMGTEMAEGLAEDVGEALTGEEMTAEQKAEMEKGKSQAEAKTAELTKRYEAILERHGLVEMMNDDTPVPDEPEARRAALAKMFERTDEVALLTDLMGLMSDVGGEEGMKSGPMDLDDEVTDYRIDGDHATAKSGDETLTFVKVDGRWYFEPESQSAGPGAPGEDGGDGARR